MRNSHLCCFPPKRKQNVAPCSYTTHSRPHMIIRFLSLTVAVFIFCHAFYCEVHFLSILVSIKRIITCKYLSAEIQIEFKT